MNKFYMFIKFIHIIIDTLRINLILKLAQISIKSQLIYQIPSNFNIFFPLSKNTF